MSSKLCESASTYYASLFIPTLPIIFKKFLNHTLKGFTHSSLIHSSPSKSNFESADPKIFYSHSLSNLIHLCRPIHGVRHLMSRSLPSLEAQCKRFQLIIVVKTKDFIMGCPS